MALEHALLVSLREQPAAGLELARRFSRSIGFFWSATHQQIYKVLRRMEDDGWVTSEVTAQDGRRDKTVYTVSPLGERVLAEWIAAPTPDETFRIELAVKMRGASYGDRQVLLAELRMRIADHRARLALYEQLRQRDYADPAALTGQDLDQYLVLRGGLLIEQFWIDWITEYIDAHTSQGER